MSPELERLIGKAVIDKDFRDKLIANPDKAMDEAGITLKDEEKKQVLKAAEERGKDPAKTDQALDAARGSSWN